MNFLRAVLGKQHMLPTKDDENKCGRSPLL